jgi:hypothetical protein
LSTFLIGFKRFLFNALLFLGSLSEEYEPENVWRPAREKKGGFRPEFESTKRKVTCHFAKSGEIECDLLVGADGSRSFVRLTLFPEMKPRYAGYVAWRGVVAESEAGCDLLDAALNEWEPRQLDLGRRLEAQGIMLGNRSQFSH